MTRFTVSTMAQVAAFFGRSPSTIREWKSRGMPVAADGYNLSDVTQWLVTSGPWRQPEPDADPAMLGADHDSPALERYRGAKAALAEMELADKQATLMDRQKLVGALDRMTDVVDRLGKRLGEQFGPEAAKAVTNTAAELRCVIAELEK